MEPDFFKPYRKIMNKSGFGALQVPTEIVDCLIRIIEHPLFDVNYRKNSYSNPPLFDAAYYLNYTIVEELIKKGADINYINEEGDNVLMYLIKELNDRIEDLENDEEPQQIIEDSKMNEIIRICILLIQYGVKIDYKIINNELININKYNIELHKAIKITKTIKKSKTTSKRKTNKKIKSNNKSKSYTKK
jgi:hypothetical protein